VKSLSCIPPSLAEQPPRQKPALLLGRYEFLLRASIISRRAMGPRSLPEEHRYPNRMRKVNQTPSVKTASTMELSKQTSQTQPTPEQIRQRAYEVGRTPPWRTAIQLVTGTRFYLKVISRQCVRKETDMRPPSMLLSTLRASKTETKVSCRAVRSQNGNFDLYVGSL
jgi:hypothetical protein